MLTLSMTSVVAVRSTTAAGPVLAMTAAGRSVNLPTLADGVGRPPRHPRAPRDLARRWAQRAVEIGCGLSEPPSVALPQGGPQVWTVGIAGG